MPVPLDIYSRDVDFTALSLQYPDFAKKLKANRQLDFSEPESVRQLTKALLHRDFNLTIDLSDDRLCPPVPNRFNYIIFIQKLLDSTQSTYTGKHDPSRRIIGLDIGTGASAIYPLLACRQNPTWLFLGTEIDPKSAEYATRNVKQNGLDSRIKILPVASGSEQLIPSDELESIPKADILITNPPFYSSEFELHTLAKQKSRPPNSACTGAPIEMIYPGGEVAFVTRLIHESKLPHIRTKIQWFSSMFGKLSSVDVIIQKLREVGCTNYAVTEFVQGQKTRRWCVAWSWLGLRPAAAIARGADAVEKKFLPFPTDLEIIFSGPSETITRIIQRELANLEGMDWRWNDETSNGIGKSATGDVWSRKARRKMQKRTVNQDSMDIDTQHSSSQDQERNNVDFPYDMTEVFAFRITVSNPKDEVSKSPSSTTQITVHVRWLEGQDSTIFESFHGWLKRKLVQ